MFGKVEEWSFGWMKPILICIAAEEKVGPKSEPELPSSILHALGPCLATQLSILRHAEEHLLLKTANNGSENSWINALH